MNREPKVRTYQARPRASVPSPDSALRDAVVIAFCIGLLAVIYLFADTFHA